MEQELLRKMRYKEGRAAVLNAPAGFQLGIETEGVTTGSYDFVMLLSTMRWK